MRRSVLAVFGLLVSVVPAQEPTPESFVLEGAVAVPFRDSGGVRLRLHLFRPEGWQPTDRRPAVVFFFGGGWVGGTPGQFAPQARYLAARGMVAACAEYRVARRHETSPQDAVADAQAVIAWVVAHAAEQGIDPLRIAAAGGSAGGHLAACAGVAPFREAAANVRPAALVLFNPVLDCGPEGFGHRRVGDDWRSISPVHQVRPGAPPTLVLHGTGDRTVPFAQARRFRVAMAAADARCDVIGYEDRGHGFFNAGRGDGRDFFRTTRAMDRFLASLGWLEGPPTLAEPGTATWHGLTRHDSEIDGRRLIVVEPDMSAPGRPWIWRARFFGHEPQTDLALLARGFHLVFVDVADLYGNDTALRLWDGTYARVRESYGLARKVALEGMSRGGLVVYRWAARNPGNVACIYGDAPVCDVRSWPGGKGRGKGGGDAWQVCLAAHALTEESVASWRGNPIDVLAPLAATRLPLLHVCGEVDDVVPVGENTRVLAERYRALGGSIEVIVKPGVGHHPHSLPDPKPIVDFVLRHTVGDGDWFELRGGLQRSRARMRAHGRGRVAFLGGSISHNPGWRDLVAADLERRLPGVELEFVNAGIPSFGSTPGAFRLQRDVLDRGLVDLLFVEAAVNDEGNGRSHAEAMRGMEGIVRAVRRASPWTDVVMLQFVDPAKMVRIRRGEVPIAIAAHEAVARCYGVPSVDLAAEVTWRIAAGDFTWKDDFKNLHPSPFGQRLYASAIARLLDCAWAAEPEGELAPHTLPSPVDLACYQGGRLVAPNEAVDLEGFQLDPSWQPGDRAGTRAGFVRVPMLVATAPGASCALRANGSALGVLVVAGPDAGVLEWSVDGGPWSAVDLFTKWSGGLHLPWSHVLAAELEDGPHELRLRVSPRPKGTRGGSAVRIAQFLVNGRRK